MSLPLNDYTAALPNWRASIRQNAIRTYIVILIFICIYGSLGFLIDAYLVSSHYHATLSQIFWALLTFIVVPKATLIMLAVAAGSLLVSYIFYDRLMLLGTEYIEVDASSSSPTEKQLYNIIEELKVAAGLRYMPKVFVINADYMNAFASGYSERSVMVAITHGLLQKLDRDELSAVMAHELSHIRHLDIKLTLTASLLANLTLMILDIFFYSMLYGREREDRSRHSIFTILIILRYTLPVINLLLILYLSRTRELMADAGAVQLMRANEPLARALLKIQNDHITNKDQYAAAYNATPHENVRREAYFYDPLQAGIQPITSISDAFSTHPSLQTRLEALGYIKNK